MESSENIAKPLAVDREALTILANFLSQINESQLDLEKLGNLKSQRLNTILNEIQASLLEHKQNFRQLQSFLVEQYQGGIFSTVPEVATFDKIKHLGLTFLKNAVIEKPFRKVKIIPAITQEYWHQISNVFLASENSQIVIKKLNSFYLEFIEKEIEKELKKVPMRVNPQFITEYRKVYSQKRINFEEFVKTSAPIEENQISSNRIASINTSQSNLREEFEAALERKKNEQEKDAQLSSFDNYHSFFKMDDRELKRAKRQGDSARRVVSKQTRREKFKK